MSREEAREIGAQILKNWRENAARMAGLSSAYIVPYLRAIAEGDYDAEILYDMASGTEYAPPEEYE